MTLRRVFALSLLTLAPIGCVDLPDVPAGVCGNGVVEPGEDCDGYEPDGQLCRGSDAPHGACHWDCSPPSDEWGDKPPPQCPAGGWSCGRDATCHLGLGVYEPWTDGLLPKQPNEMRLGDLDGDGLDDLLTLGNPNRYWQSIPNILFFDESGNEAAPTYNPQTRISSPVLASILPNGPGQARKQIVTGTAFGVAVLEADSERRVSARANPFQTIPVGSEYRLVRVHGVKDTPLHEEVLLYLSENGQSVLSAAATGTDLGKLDRAPSELSGHPTSGNIDRRPISPCDELVLAYKKDPEIFGVRFCDAAGALSKFDGPPEVIASLPQGHVPSSRALLARIDSDENLDLVIADESNCPYVSFGLGDGRFAANLELPNFTIGQMWPLVTERGQCPNRTDGSAVEYPLAIGDLNEDGWSDWVLPIGISLVTNVTSDPQKQQVLVAGVPNATPYVKFWTTARVAELTGDTHLDVVAGSAYGPDLDFFFGTGRDRLNPATIETEGPVTDTLTGDYDGNLINDIAFIQKHAPTSTDLRAPTNGLAVAYGSQNSIPADVAELARFNDVIQLISGNYESTDAVEEIGVLAESTDHNATQLTMFVGNPGRHPISSLGLWQVVPDDAPSGSSASMTAVGGPPIASTVGHFLDSKRFGILALAVDECPEPRCPYRLWYAPDASAGDLAAPSDRITSPEFLPYRWEANELSVHFAVGPIDSQDPNAAAPLDNALMLTAGPDENHISLWRVTLPLTAAPLSLFSIAPGWLTAAASPLLVDLDRDNRRDLAFLVAESSNAAQRLAIVWNDEGTFDLERAEYLRLDGTEVHGLARRDANDRTGLFVLTGNGVHSLEWNKRRQHSAEAVRFANGISLPGGDALAIGDMTGDGLMDLAVANPDGIRVFRELEDKGKR